LDVAATTVLLGRRLLGIVSEDTIVLLCGVCSAIGLGLANTSDGFETTLWVTKADSLGEGRIALQ
jgi:hypothetical protein